MAENGRKEAVTNGTKDDAPSDQKTGESAELVELGQKCDLKSLEERYNKDGALEVSECGKFRKGSKERFEDYALVTTQIFNKDSTLRTATLQVNSPYILQILREVVRSYATQPAGFELPITEEAPFALFYHHRTELQDYKPKDDTVKQHHRLLLDWIDAELGKICREVDRLTSKGFITFPLLWALYKPGELQYSVSHGHPRLYRLETVAYKDNGPVKGPSFEVNNKYVDYNGTTVGLARERLQMFDRQIFTGTSPTRIASLPVFPRKFVDDETLEERLRIRGNRMLEFKGIRVMQYEGLLEYLKLPPYAWWGPVCERDGVWTPISIAGRVVLDKKTFADDFANESESVEETPPKPDPQAQNAYLLASAISEIEDDYADPMLCPPFTIGYALDRKLWCRLYIDQLSEINWQPNPMDALILPHTQKKVLQALVASHIFPADARDEWGIKGKGLVVLLHGTPGTGKTLTAETAAEYTQKALLKVSLSELKDDDRLEQNMLQFQRYASTWKAIVLIDEADVFLEARSTASKDSTDRNGLVAVFLRTLEYFQGIIFLTSNRVSVFDTAIKSRIHLALQYASPSTASRRQLWRNALSALPPHSTEFSDDIKPSKGGESGKNSKMEEVLDAVEKVEMNGREISNSIHTALTLARDEKVRLGKGHLEMIIRVWKGFAEQLEGVGGEW